MKLVVMIKGQFQSTYLRVVLVPMIEIQSLNRNSYINRNDLIVYATDALLDT